MYTDESIMPRGKYKFRRLKEIPASYFLTIYNSNGLNGVDPELKEYIISNLERIQERENNPVPFVPQIVPFICKKKTFATKRMALDSLNNIRGHGGEHKKPQRAYECPRCSGWHLTSQDKADWKKKQKE